MSADMSMSTILPKYKYKYKYCNPLSKAKDMRHAAFGVQWGVGRGGMHRGEEEWMADEGGLVREGGGSTVISCHTLVCCGAY